MRCCKTQLASFSRHRCRLAAGTWPIWHKGASALLFIGQVRDDEVSCRSLHAIDPVASKRSTGTGTGSAPVTSAMGWSGRAPAPPVIKAGKGMKKDKEHAMSQKFNAAIAVIGIDIGKNSFHIVGHDCVAHRAAAEVVAWPGRGAVRQLPPCLIGMEACVGAHHLSRKLHGLGHDARLMPAKYVRPYSKGQRERLPRCGGDRRSGAAADDEVRGDEDGGSARPASAPSRARAIGQPAYRHHQSDPRFPIGARDCGAAGPTLLTRSCRASWLHPRMSCRRAWCGSSRT